MVKSTHITGEKAVKTADKKPSAPSLQQPTRQPDVSSLQNLQRGIMPGNLRPADILQLQRSLGNQAVRALLGRNSPSRLPIQAKLTIGQPDDQYEHEADRIAAKVVEQINAPPTSKATQEQPERGQALSGKNLQTKSTLQLSEAIQGGEASTQLESAINRAKGGGRPLNTQLQQSMEQAMEADFSGVRVHTNAQSHQLNLSIQAKAFTTGQDVFFRQGAYQPESRSGQELIAHELTHVAQQNNGNVQRLVQREVYLDLRGISPKYDLEQTVQRDDIHQVVGWYKSVLSKHYIMIQALEKVPADDADGLNNVKGKLHSLPPPPPPIGGWEDAERDRLNPLNYDDTMTELKRIHKTQLEKAVLQEIPINEKGEITDPTALAGRLVKYDTTPEEQAKTLVSLSGGKLIRNATHPTDPGADVDTAASVTQQTGKGWEIFVMSPTGALHMASHKIGKYHHSSLLAGGAVAAAGSIKAAGGKIKALNNKSGHYQPGATQMRQVLHRLMKAGINLDFNLDIKKGNSPHADDFNGKAELYMKHGDEGGHHGLPFFEEDTTRRVVWYFINKLCGVDGGFEPLIGTSADHSEVKNAFDTAVTAISNKFSNKAWSYQQSLSDTKPTVTKPDGAPATDEEVRNFLITEFGDTGAQEITKPQLTP